MNKIVKNLLIVFTLLCAIVLAVFFVELIILNRSSGGDEDGPSMSDSSSENPGDETAGSGTPGTDTPEEPGQNGDPDQSEIVDIPEEPTQPPVGKRYELPMSDETKTLIIYAEEELFEYAVNEFDWEFRYSGSGKASLVIAYDYVTPPAGINDLAATFLTNYLNGGESTVIGKGQIGASQLSGIHVVGEADKETYEVWIHEPFDGSEFGNTVTFVINYENETQKNVLYDLLDTMKMLTETSDEE